MSTKQLPVSLPIHVRTRLAAEAAQRSVPMAQIAREAIEAYLDRSLPISCTPEAVWSILRDPLHWATFLEIAKEMSAKPTPTAPPPPRPSWRHTRTSELPPRQIEPAPVPDEEPPF